MTVLHQLHEQIYLTEVHFPDYIVRGGVFLGRETAVVWDSLSHPDDMQAILPLVENRRLVVVYSHADWDHVWGTAAFAACRPVVIGQSHCRERFTGDVPVTLAERQVAEPGLWDAVELVPPDIVFDHKYFLDLGGLTLQIFALAGHSPDSVVGFLPEYGLLFMGDTVETPLPCVPPECPLEKWLDELHRWQQDTRVKTVIPAHGPYGGPEIINQTIGYLQDLADGRDRQNLCDLNPFYRQTHLENRRNRGLL